MGMILINIIEKIFYWRTETSRCAGWPLPDMQGQYEKERR
jgi:hypothetical protein